jgi:hypothetical protein
MGISGRRPMNALYTQWLRNLYPSLEAHFQGIPYPGAYAIPSTTLLAGLLLGEDKHLLLLQSTIAW